MSWASDKIGGEIIGLAMIKQENSAKQTPADHLKHRTGSLGGDQDEKAVEQLIADYEAQSALMELACADIVFFHSQESAFTVSEGHALPFKVAFSVLVNDLFFPAADAEGLDISEAIPLRDIYRKDGYEGVVRWVQAKRGNMPLRAHVEKRVKEKEDIRAALAQKTRDEQQALEYASGLEKINVEQNATIAELRAELSQATDRLHFLEKALEDHSDRACQLVERNVQLEAQVEQLGRQVAEMSKPVTEEEFDEYFHMQFGASRDVATINEINALLASRARTK